MNLYFLESLSKDKKVELVVTARNKEDLLKVVNHYLYNLHSVTDYYQRAEYATLFDTSKLVMVIIDGYHDDPSREYPSKTFVVKERQYSPNRVYDIV